MKNVLFTLIILTGMLILNISCKNRNAKEPTKEVTMSKDASSDLIVVARDIITEVIVKQDSLGDPWEFEKVKNYNGGKMFSKLFENISDKKVTVYNNLTGDPLSPDEVKKIEKEIGSDLSRIAKLQFQEDWYFDPVSNKIIKKLKSASFGYMSLKEETGPVRYKALFKLKIEE
jgi:hypothetical protein